MEDGMGLIVKYEKLLFQARYEGWINHCLFSARWWILLAMLILPWFVWYKLTDKKRFQEMCLYILATSIIATMLDEIGTSLCLWSYPINIVPFFPRLITTNYTMVPIIFTLAYQYFRDWKSFIIVNIILAFVFSLVFEPILVQARLYKLITWKHIYSIPVYFLASVLLKWFAGWVNAVQKKYST